MVSSLRQSEATGTLPSCESTPATIHEIRELIESFSRAASAVRESGEDLQQAYPEFIGSLAGALDARADYTAGHSRRVSEYSCVIAYYKNLQYPVVGNTRRRLRGHQGRKGEKNRACQGNRTNLV